MRKVFFSLVLAIGFVSGCGRPFNVSVSSLARKDSPVYSKYILAPSNQNISANDLQFQEYAGYIDRLLQSIGYEKTTDFNNAELAIFLDYGISEPKEHTYSYSVPQYGETGIASSYTTGNIDSYGNFSGSTTYTPSYGITGYSNHVGTVTYYTRHLRLNARDLKLYRETQEDCEVWDTCVVSTGQSGDLRVVFPVMVASLYDYAGTNTKQAINVQLYENDKKVKFIKGEIEISDLK